MKHDEIEAQRAFDSEVEKGIEEGAAERRLHQSRSIEDAVRRLHSVLNPTPDL